MARVGRLELGEMRPAGGTGETPERKGETAGTLRITHRDDPMIVGSSAAQGLRAARWGMPRRRAREVFWSSRVVVLSDPCIGRDSRGVAIEFGELTRGSRPVPLPHAQCGVRAQAQ
jgi:hypothetical protein